MKNRALWILSIIPLIVTSILIQFMDSPVPMHYDSAGNIDRWGSKYEQLIIPVIILFIALIWMVYLHVEQNKVDKAKTEQLKVAVKDNVRFLYIVAIGMIVMFSIMDYYFLLSAIVETGHGMKVAAFDLNMGTNILLAIFIIVLGCFLPKVKMGSSVGIRTVWSMDNEKTWSESNRMGGRIMLITGVLIIVESLLVGGIASTIIEIGIILAMAIVMIFYSYRIYNKYGNNKKTNKFY